MAARRPRLVLVVLLVLAVLAAAAVPVVLTMRARQEQEALRTAVRTFATAWRSGALAQTAYVSPAGTPLPASVVAEQMKKITSGLGGTAPGKPAAVDVAAQEDPRDGTASSRLSVRWDLGGRRWAYDSTVQLRSIDGRWRVVWTPTVVHPQLAAGQVLRAARSQPRRADIVGADGVTLVTERPVVHVGIDPGGTRDRNATARAVAAIVDVDPADLGRRVRQAAPGTFVDVITLRRPAYDRVRDRLRPVPGAVFREGTLPLAPTAQFARALLGSVGPATKELVEASKGRLRAGDVTGLTGLQRTYDEHLGGSAGLVVRAVAEGDTAEQDAAEQDTAAGGGSASGSALFEVPAVDGKPLTVTLDPEVQQAAERALEQARRPAALVAVRPSTGEVLAVANGGPNAAGYNRALLGRYPPGSTFKVVSTLALLRRGITPSTPVNCPASFTVQGRKFTNAEGEVLGRVPFRTDFALSCNTAFVGSASRVSGAQLVEASKALGFDAANTTGTEAFMGSVPDSDEAVEHAANMIGQGKVLASPLTLAVASGSVAAGAFSAPRLVTEPAPEGSDAQPVPLRASTADDLRALMRAVVTSGTGTAVRNVPGGPVHGKTGTAEFGSRVPPQTHAWFTGFQGDVAFAVVVEGGGFGGKVAAPLAADFLRRLG